MKVNEAELALKILELVGGAQNVVSATNCMTRLRLLVKDEKIVKVTEIKKIMGVLGMINDGTLIQVVLGPGVVRKVTEEFNELISFAVKDVSVAKINEEVRQTKENHKRNLSKNKFLAFFQKIVYFFADINWKKGLRHVGNCFSPLIPGFIFFGICYALSVIVVVISVHGDGKLIQEAMQQLSASGTSKYLGSVGITFYWLFNILANGFMAYMSVFIGVTAAKEFGVTPIIGGTIGGISLLSQLSFLMPNWVVDLSSIGIEEPVHLISAGDGGPLAVILAVFLVGYLERFIKKHMPNVLDTVCTPLFTVVIGGGLFLFALMPVLGVANILVTDAIAVLSSFDAIWLRAIVGFVLAAIFLPIISLGLHHALSGFYSYQCQQPGGLVLYPIFSMNDACQVGVAASIYLKAKKANHKRLMHNIQGGIIPEVLGVSEPLIYGMTMPMGKPYLAQALGAGVAGAWINAWGIGFCAFDCSGLMGIPLCMYVRAVSDDTPNIPLAMGLYVCGWLIAVISGFIFARFIVTKDDLEKVSRE